MVDFDRFDDDVAYYRLTHSEAAAYFWRVATYHLYRSHMHQLRAARWRLKGWRAWMFAFWWETGWTIVRLLPW